MYERKGNEIITEAIDIMGDNISFVVTDDGMLSDDGYMYGEAFMSGVEDCWNDKEARLIIEFYGCGLFNDEIVCRTDDGLEREIPDGRQEERVRGEDAEQDMERLGEICFLRL